jgi:hypothetical protein
LDNLSGSAANFDLLENILQGIPPRNKLFLIDTFESGEIVIPWSFPEIIWKNREEACGLDPSKKKVYLLERKKTKVAM